MKVQRLKKGLPRGMMKADGLLLSHDLSITKSRLKAKLLVFETPKHLRHFWKHTMKFDLGRYAVGAVNGLKMTYADHTGKDNEFEARLRGKGDKAEKDVSDRANKERVTPRHHRTLYY